MKFLILSFLFVMPALAKTTASFVDACSKKAIRVSTPNGTRLNVNLTKLDPNDDLELTVTFRPAGLVEDLGGKNTKVFSFFFGAHGERGMLGRKIDVSSTGTLNVLLPLPSLKWMWQVEQRNSEYRIWDAEVSWIQSGARKAGSDIATFYRAPVKEKFFQIQSEGLCQWETEAEVSSKLYENRSTTWMNVMRDTSKVWEQSNGPGLTLGYNNNTGSSQPLGANSQNYGWLFKEWQKQLTKQQIFTYERKFVLNKEEMGVFITRMSFNRHEVKRYDWVPEAGACGEYSVTDEGHLDVGQTSEDFIVLPRSFYPRADELKKFVNTVRPAVNNCGDTELSGPQFATDIIPSGANGILYFYSNLNNRSLR